MRYLELLALLAVEPVTAILNFKELHPALADRLIRPQDFVSTGQPAQKRATTTSKFLNDKTRAFAVNGTKIPDVGWDIGESYAGLLPIGGANDTNQLYYWFFPSSNPAADKEIMIWITGGPGCSSTGELLQENGPFLWQPGVFQPVANPWSWHKLTNVVWIDQPVGAGFSMGQSTARDERDVANQFMGFWKNFVDTYSLQGYKVYVTGSSYSGMFSPYVASAMLDANDKQYFNVSGMLIFDGTFSKPALAEDIVAASFHDSWEREFNFNDTFKTFIKDTATKCGFTDYVQKYLAFPPAGVQPSSLPGATDEGPSGGFTPGCDLWDQMIIAVLDNNPCFSPYEIMNGCPRKFDPLGFSDSSFFVPDGFGPVYFNRPDVKAAINAPNKEWTFCNSDDNPVFVNHTDGSLLAGPGSQPVIPNVIDRTQNVIIGHGAKDFVLIADGTLLAIQNMTWGGKLGFQARPSTQLVIPELGNQSLLGAPIGGGAGVVGTFHTERGFTYFGVEAAGHFLTQDAPHVAYRSLEVLLGRIDGFASTKPFTTDQGAVEVSNQGASSQDGDTTAGNKSAVAAQKISSWAGKLDVRSATNLGLLATGLAASILLA